jgi:hypothetical protein
MALRVFCEQAGGLAYLLMKTMDEQIPFGAKTRLAGTGSRRVDYRVGTGGFHDPRSRIFCPR